MDDAGFPAQTQALRALQDAVADAPLAGHALKLVCAEDLRFTFDQIAPVTEIVREAVANALAHAFPCGRTGTVWVSLMRHDGRYRLRIGDDGIGIPDIDLDRMPGLARIEAAAQALGGYARMGSASRTGGEVVVTFR